MNKEVQMTFRVEPELRNNFTKAAEYEHRPAAQVLREFMRSYVSQSEQLRATKPAHDLISPQERLRREKAASFVRASVGLEGFKMTEKEAAHTQRFVNGEIDLEAFIHDAQ